MQLSDSEGQANIHKMKIERTMHHDVNTKKLLIGRIEAKINRNHVAIEA